jgi:RNA polymerase sigma factor (sigma-70 family)
MTDRDTGIGGANDRFPPTNHSAIVRVRSKDAQERERAFEAIVAVYWKPAYKYLRIKWQASNEDAKDLVQGFFALAIEKNYFASYEAGKAAFRTFLRTCLDGFVANQRKAESRLKRGGGADHFSLDFTEAEHELSHGFPSTDTPEDYFHREWVRNLFAMAVETLSQHYRATARDVYFQLFERYDLRDEASEPKPSYASLAKEFGLTTTEVTNYLAAARREFRKAVLERLRETTSNEEEFRREAQAVLGANVK